MVYHFRVISNEVDDFIFEIAIDSNALFIDFHTFIQKELGFDSSQITSFFITDDEWNKEIEVTLLDMLGDSDQHRVMDQVKLDDLLDRPKNRLLYAFDLLADRVLFMELAEIKEGSIDKPLCLRLEGTPPPQYSEVEFALSEEDLSDEFNSFGIDQDDLDEDWENDNQKGFYGEEPDDKDFY